MPELRRAEPGDGPRIVRLLADRMFPEMALDFAPADEPRALEAIDRLIGYGIVLLLVHDGELVGALGLEVRPFWWSRATALGDLFFYIIPEHRSASNARLLTRAAQKVARDLGVPLLMGGFGSPRLSPLNRFFRLLRFVEIGSLFLWR